jgi:lipopolysaccharide transport system ATP-binding protein
MRSETVVRLRDASKCYEIYRRPLDRLVQVVARPARPRYREFWALRNVNIEIGRGQTVGILGRNGSGKSTLLQLVAGILEPSAGAVEVNGRVAAILELGAGFNPEFTGRENVLMNAAIMGLSAQETEEAFDSIVAFAELEAFIDQPVRTYSSGMYVRLAFAVAISMKPEVLIVDEALAVGDIRFQRKCFRELERMRERGVTTLFVTHATQTVINLCDRAIFLDSGRVLHDGEPRDVVNEYLNFLFGSEEESGTGGVSPDGAGPAAAEAATTLERPVVPDAGCSHRAGYNRSEFRWGSREGEIMDFQMFGPDGAETAEVGAGAAVRINMTVLFHRDIDIPVYGLTVRTVDGTVVYGTNTFRQKTAVASGRAGERAQISFTFAARLVGGDYFISLGLAEQLAENDHRAVDRRYDLIHLQVGDDELAFGVADLDARIEAPAPATRVMSE